MTTFKNFAISRVATAPIPDTVGTSLVVESGDGSLFSTEPFNATVWPIGEIPLSSNAEIVRVTRSGDTFTIERQQEGSNARAIEVGDQISATITAETVRDFRNVNTVIIDDPYTVQRNDDLIVCNKSGDMTVHLPAATGSGRLLRIKNINTGIVSINPYLIEQIEDEFSIPIYNRENLTIVDYDIGQWIVI